MSAIHTTQTHFTIYLIGISNRESEANAKYNYLHLIEVKNKIIGTSSL